MYVICFYWQGDRWQKDLDLDSVTDLHYRRALERVGSVSNELASQYVNNLYYGVAEHATRPFDFICFTNEPLVVDEAVELRPFPLHTTQGVLPRVYMFSSEANLGNRQVLCLDLDIVIVGSLKKIMDYNGLFCARSKFKLGEEWKLDGDIMSFRAGEEAERLFWTPFIEDLEYNVEFTKGRERYWIRHVADDFADRWDKIAPKTVLSYKRHMTGRQNVPPGTAIISCHGTPRPHQIKSRWVKKYWYEWAD